MTAARGVVVVGGGLAAQRAAETLRRGGCSAPIRIVCAEAEPPYDRPPLSKGVLAGSVAADSVGFRPPDWYRDNGVELRLGSPARALDPARRALVLDRGEVLRYDRLLIATGAAPRRLPFLEHANVHYLRSRDDARRLRAAMRPGARLAIVGAGFIGQEVAATARGLGLEVTILEALEHPLEPVLGRRLGAWFGDLQRSEGVRMLTGVPLAGAAGDTRVEELLLADGRRVGCDLVLVGVGTVPATGWLAGSGLDPGGPQVDRVGRTRAPGVFAAGDACVPVDPRSGTRVRTEHWNAAAWQGAAAARAMLGEDPGPPPLPSFWSDQYGVRIQCVGHPAGADAVRIEGDLAARDFEALLTRGGVPVAGLAVGRPRALPGLRRKIERGGAAAAEEVVMA